jgi:hypothetical protein
MSLGFTVTFINSEAKAKNDNVLEVSPSDEGFVWRYKDATLPSGHKVVLTLHGAYDRMETLLDMVYYDRYPVEMVQVDVPGYPSTIYKHEDLKHMRRIILESFYMTLKTWPSRDLPPLPSSPCRSQTPQNRPAPVAPRAPTQVRKHMIFHDE